MISGTFYGLQTSDNKDAEYTSDYNAVCDKLAEDEESSQDDEE